MIWALTAAPRAIPSAPWSLQQRNACSRFLFLSAAQKISSAIASGCNLCSPSTPPALTFGMSSLNSCNGHFFLLVRFLQSETALSYAQHLWTKTQIPGAAAAHRELACAHRRHRESSDNRGAAPLSYCRPHNPFQPRRSLAPFTAGRRLRAHGPECNGWNVGTRT